MPLPAAMKNLVEKKLDAFLGKRVPPRVTDKIRLSYTFQGGCSIGVTGIINGTKTKGWRQ